MIDNFNLRLFQPTDEPFLYDLFLTTIDTTLFDALPPQMRQQILQMQFTARERTFHGYENAEDFIVEIDGRQIGRMFTQETPAELRLIDIAILPTLRGQGVGSALFSQLTQHANETQKPLRLHVATTNVAAQRFYYQHGCRVIASNDAYLLIEYAFVTN